MTVTYNARLDSIRVAPRKARLVIDLVRGRPVSDALEILRLTNKRSAPLVSKLIESAIANAQSKATVDVDRLIIKEAYVDPGPMFRRFLPRAQGRATPIRKRTSHITVKLSEL